MVCKYKVWRQFYFHLLFIFTENHDRKKTLDLTCAFDLQNSIACGFFLFATNRIHVLSRYKKKKTKMNVRSLKNIKTKVEPRPPLNNIPRYNPYWVRLRSPATRAHLNHAVNGEYYRRTNICRYIGVTATYVLRRPSGISYFATSTTRYYNINIATMQ